MDNEIQSLFCDKCKKTMNVKEFYKSRNLEKYPTGYFTQCKKCLTMFVDNWDPETYLWILQDADVPYVPDEWHTLLKKYGKDRSKVSGTSIIGRYFSKMQLNQYKDYHWSDSEYLQQRSNDLIKETMKNQGYGAADIQTILDQRQLNLKEGGYTQPAPPPPPPVESLLSQNEYQFGAQAAPDDDVVIDLTDEERLAMRLKWGKGYRADEWVQLEKLYQEMEQSYDVQGAGHEDILKMVCKTSLKANQLLDIGDVDGAQKMVKMYDTLMKSGRFTAAQNKNADGEYLNSISEFTVMCEQKGFMPRFYTDGPQDKVDAVIADMQGYTRSLVVDEMNLGNLIENAVKQMTMEEQKEEDEDIEDDDLNYDDLDELKDADISAFKEWQEDELDEQDQLMNDMLEAD